MTIIMETSVNIVLVAMSIWKPWAQHTGLKSEDFNNIRFFLFVFLFPLLNHEMYLCCGFEHLLISIKFGAVYITISNGRK